MANFCPLPIACLDAWRRTFFIYDVVICLDGAVLRSELRYEDRSSPVYWNTQLAWGRRTLSDFGRFVPNHLLGCYNLKDGALSRMFLQTVVEFDALRICYGMKVKQELFFSYMARALIDDDQSGQWVVAYMERVICTFSGVLPTAYEQYELWYVIPDTIAFAHRLGMDIAMVLGSPGTFVSSLKCSQ